MVKPHCAARGSAMRNRSGACSLAAMKLSVLDQSPVRQGVTPRDALLETNELARHVDALGYCRYWLAEHHSSPGLAGTAPEIMVARVASPTSHIRGGPGGGVLIPYSAPEEGAAFR